MDIACRGQHHADQGRQIDCPRCGRTVVRTHQGHLAAAMLNRQGSGYRFYCWTHHECDEQQVPRYAAAVAQSIVNGEPVVGAQVEVVRGRKVPQGTVGVVRVVDTEGAYGTRVALSVEGTDPLVWTAASNVEPTTAALAAAEETVAEWAEVNAAWDARVAAAEADLVALSQEQATVRAQTAAMTPEERTAWWEADGEALVDGFMARADAAHAEIAAVKAERGW